MLKGILKGAGADALKYFPVRLVPALTSLVTVPVFTRLIGTRDYGDFYLVSSATSLLINLATAWVASSLVRFYWVAYREERMDEYTATVLWVTVLSTLTISVISGVLLWVFRGSLSPGVARLVPAAIAALIVNASFSTLLQVMRAANRATPFAVLSVSSTLIGTAAAVYLVAGPHLGSLGIIAGIALGNAVCTPFLIRRLGEEGSLSPASLSPPLLRELLQYGLPLIPTGISSWALVLADRYVIGFFRGASEVGLYSVAYGLGDKLMALVTMPLIATMAPVLVETFEKQGQHLAQRTQSEFTRYLAMACAPLLAGLAVAGQDFMTVFTGPAYRSAFPILAIVASGSVCASLAQLAGTGLGLHRRSTIIMTNALIAATFNVVANIVLVPRFGYMAAAYDTLASYFLLFALTLWRSRAYMAWLVPWAGIGKVIAAAATMAAVLWLVFPGVSASIVRLLAQIVVGVVIYLAALVMYRALDAEEIGFFKDAARSVWRRVRPGGGSAS
jgi:O-antigen/teichoic acid export membrane protein